MVNLKTGKLAAEHDVRTLMLADYIEPAKRPVPKPTMDWRPNVRKRGPYGMRLNNKYGCCAWAMNANGIYVQTVNANHISNPSRIYNPTDHDVLLGYMSTGFNPNAALDLQGNNPTDNGTVLLTMLKYLQRVGMAGHKIGPFCAVNMRDPDEVRLAIEWFGVLYAGVRFYDAWEFQHVWNLDPSFKFDGGHAILGVAYDAMVSTKGVNIVSWNDDNYILPWKTITDGGVDEMYVAANVDWVNGKGYAPNGLDWAAIMVDFHNVQSMTRSGPPKPPTVSI